MVAGSDANSPERQIVRRATRERSGQIGTIDSRTNRGATDTSTSIGPVGGYPEEWIDTVHEEDGHDIADVIGGCGGEEGCKLLRRQLNALYTANGIAVATDDVSNAELIPRLVEEARKVEMKYFEDMGVYDRVPREHQLRTGGKIIKTRWIDVNKGIQRNLCTGPA